MPTEVRFELCVAYQLGLPKVSLASSSFIGISGAHIAAWPITHPSPSLLSCGNSLVCLQSEADLR